jgi:leader peptidase (prepilin peptidase)/N-methyltransferase
MAYYFILIALMGAAIGSFLNVIIDRLPAKQSLLFPPSHCPACGKRLNILDLMPVLSYLCLGGRCRYCRAPIPRRILWVESGTMAGFVFLLWWYGLSPELGIMCFYWSLLTVILVIGLERGLILDKIIYPAGAVALLINVFSRDPGVINSLLDSLLGGGVGLLVMILPLSLGRRGLGWGDVKMAGLVGLMLGFPLVLVALFLAVVAGGLVAGLLLLFKVIKRNAAVAFSPFLAVATMVVLLCGQNIMDWYLGLF